MPALSQAAPLPVWAATLLAGLVGLAAGSFLNTVIDRWPRGESLLRPPSHCESCGRRLGPLELVPVASWLVLRGRCRTCGAPIGWQAPAVEAATALLFAAVAAAGRGWAERLLGLGLVALLVVATGVDLKVRLIPDGANALGAAWALLVGFLGRGAAFWPHLAAGAAAGLLFALIGLLSRGGLGGGDVKLAAVLGLYLGPASAAVALFAAAVLGGGVAGVLLATKKRARRDELPFGPFLAAGALVAWFWGGPIAAAYLHWSGLAG
ncbi:MAG: prepilin peptidase [Bacillota bacterium]|nr:prepilin peptidase [Bacillota bacterium]